TTLFFSFFIMHFAYSLERYETWAFCDGKCEKVTSGILEHLVLHSAEAHSIHLKGFNSKFILSVPKKMQTRKWFTKSTLISRFLCVIGVPNILGATKPLAQEISQLEAARHFHHSLYTKVGSLRHELLRAMELRLSALRGELVVAFDQAAGSRYSVEDLIGVLKFSENFGSEDLRSFSPRRSSSPMRRIQIGRSGSWRSTAISMKSLNYYPARDRSFMTRDATSDSGDEEPVQKCDNGVKRMSVQDAIHLFESKQQKD
ncbi:hypothetical protein M569_05337, partial [Genlisea aurea]